MFFVPVSVRDHDWTAPGRPRVARHTAQGTTFRRLASSITLPFGCGSPGPADYLSALVASADMATVSGDLDRSVTSGARRQSFATSDSLIRRSLRGSAARSG